MRNSIFKTLTICFLTTFFLLTACGGGSGGSSNNTGAAPSSAAPPAAVTDLTLNLAQVKTFRFSWSDADGASSYKLLENPDGGSGFSQVGSDIPAGQQMTELYVPLYQRINARYILQSCNDAGCTDSTEFSVSGNLSEAIGYFKAPNSKAVPNSSLGTKFGASIALSADGNTLAVGNPDESSGATGVGGDETDNSKPVSGAVFVFTRGNDGVWAKQAYIKSQNTTTNASFGAFVALSADGDTLAVGSYLPGDTVEIYSRNNGSWSAQGSVKLLLGGTGSDFGILAIALSADGHTLAVGAPLDDTDGSGKPGSAATDSGAVYVFYRDTSGNWSSQRFIKAGTGLDPGDQFGVSVSLSDDGYTLAVGARFDNTRGSLAGAAYVFNRDISSNNWAQSAFLTASNADSGDIFGYSLSLSGDGNTLAVSAPGESSNATGAATDIDQTDNSAVGSGAVYVFSRSGSNWTQQAYIKASNTEMADAFGSNAIALSTDGNTLAVAAYIETSKATGINGDQTDNSATDAGAVYLFVRSDGNWRQQAYIKASNTDMGDRFGQSLDLSGDGNTLAIGAMMEASNATGIGGNQTDNSLQAAGAVYLY